MKNRQALYEIIRASCLSIIFAEHSFRLTYISHHGCEKFKIYGKLQFPEDVLVSKNIFIQDIFTHMLLTPFPPFLFVAVASI